MKKLLSILTLLMAASMLFWLAGCGGEEEADECKDVPAPSVKSVSPASGNIASNSVITVTFSKAVESATFTINGTAVTATSADNKVFTFQAGQEGALTLAIEATDNCDQGLDPAFPGASYTASAPDTVAPKLAGSKCDPKDGADGVDPTGYTEITIVCDEALDSAKTQVASVEPEISPAPSVEVSGDTVKLVFLGGYKLSNEMEVEVKLTAVDLAGNSADLTYSFATMAKE